MVKVATEADVQNAVRLAIQEAGGVAWRNNRGALPNPETGVPVRFGLANDSSKLDAVFKTGDLVGLYPVQVHYGPWGAAMTSALMAIFCMWECKKPGWTWRGTDHERAQLNAINFVRERGGRSGFVTDPAQAVAIMLGQGLGCPHG